jgi:hypothetical protein
VLACNLGDGWRIQIAARGPNVKGTTAYVAHTRGLARNIDPHNGKHYTRLRGQAVDAKSDREINAQPGVPPLRRTASPIARGKCEWTNREAEFFNEADDQAAALGYIPVRRQEIPFPNISGHPEHLFVRCGRAKAGATSVRMA